MQGKRGRLVGVVASTAIAVSTFGIMGVSTPIVAAVGPTSLAGVVTDATTGLPVAGVEVDVVVGSSLTPAATEVASAVTDETGSYSVVLAGLATAADTVTVDLLDPQGRFGVSYANPVALVDDDTAFAPFAVSPGGTVSGTVRAPGGGAIAGSCVTVRDTTTALVVPSGIAGSCTGADGRYSLPALAAGTYTLTVASPDPAVWNPIPAQQVTVVAGSAATADAVLLPVAPTSITGVVTELGSAAPLAGISVTATTTDAAGGPQTLTATTDAAGAFTLPIAFVPGPDPFVVDVVDPTGAHHPALGITISVQAGYTEAIGVTLQPTSVTPTAELSISAPQAVLIEGQPGTLEVTVANAGPTAATDVVATIEVPDFVPVTTVQAPAGFTCTTVASSVTCSAPSLGVGVAATIRIGAGSGPLAGLFGFVRMSVVASSNDTNPSDDSRIQFVSVQPDQANVSLILFNRSLEVGVSSPLVFGATNFGPAIAKDVFATVRLPDGLVIDRIESPGWGCAIDGQEVGCSAPTLAPDGRLEAKVFVTPSALATGLPISGIAGSASIDPFGVGNAIDATIDVVPAGSVDLGVYADPVFAPAPVGRTTSLMLTVVNAGPAAAADVVLAIDVPDGLDVVGAVEAAGLLTCAAAGGAVTCTSPSLARDAQARVELRVRPTAPGGPFSIPVTLTSASVDIGSQPDATTIAGLNAVADVANVGINLTTGAFAIGERGAFSAFVTNSALIPAADVAVTITVPDSFTIIAASPSFLFSSCTVEGQIVRCTTPLLSANSFGFPAATVIVVPNVAGPAEIVASVSTSSTDPSPIDNSIVRPVVVGQRSADLGVGISTPFAVVPGSETSVGVSVTNGGPIAARDVEVVVEVPPTFTLLEVSGFGFTCTAVGNVARCTIPTYVPGSFGLLSLRVRADAAGQARFTAGVTSSVLDEQPANNSTVGFVDVTVPQTNLGVFVTPPGTVVAGELGVTTVSIQNGSFVTASDVVLEVGGAGLVVNAISADGFDCAVLAGRGRCTAASVPAFRFISAAVTFTVDAGASAASLDASVRSSTPDQFPFDNDTSLPLQVQPAGTADLQAFLSNPGGSTFAEGVATEVRFGVVNVGPGRVAAPVATFTAGPAFEVVSITADQGVACTVEAGTVTCTGADVAPNAGANATVTLLPVAQTFFDSLAVTVSGAVFDPNPFNDSRFEFVSVARNESDLQVQASAPTIVEVGSEFVYSAQVFNLGPAPSAGAVLEITVPDGLAWVEGSGGCTSTVPGTLHCDLPTRTVFGVAVVDVSFLATAESAGAEITATAIAGNTDPNPFDNTFFASVAIAPQGAIDLRAIAPVVTGVLVGQPSTVTITALHAGPSAEPARDLVLTATFPAAVRVDTVGALFPFEGQAGCAIEGQTVTCSLAALPAGAALSVNVGVNGVSPAPFPGYTVDVTAAAFDPLPGNNQGIGAIEVLPFDADLVVSANPIGAIEAGAPISTAASVFNVGVAPALNPALRITPGPGLTVTDPIVFGAPEPCAADGADWVCPLPFLGRFFGATLFYTVTGTGEGDSSVTIDATADNEANPSDDLAVIPVQVFPAGSGDLFVDMSTSIVGPGGRQVVSVGFGQTGPSAVVDTARLRIDTPGLDPSTLFTFGADMTCVEEVESVVCDILGIGRFTRGVVTFEAIPVRDVPGSVVVADITGSGVDPNLDNNTVRAGAVDVRVTPGAPGIAYVAPRDGAVEVGLIGAEPGAGTVVDYVVEYSRDNGATWTRFVDEGPSDEPAIGFLVTGLRNGVTYVIRVAAVNEFGQGAWSEPSPPVTPSLPPRAPTDVSGRAGTGQVTLTWRAPSQRNRNPITDYVIEYSSDRGRTWTAFEDDISTATRTVVTGLANGTRYTFRVAAVNDAGVGRFSEPSNAVAPRAR